MGCGNSTDGKGEDGEKGFFHRRPKVSIRVGNHVKLSPDETTVVFIFGGPGSRKGRIVDDMIHMYGFKALIVEDILLEELPKKVPNIGTPNSIRETMGVVSENAGLINLEWIFQMLADFIDREPKQIYLIDIVPNLRFLLRCGAVTSDPEYELKKFVAKYPSYFALNLAITENKILEEAKAHGAKHPDKMKEGGQSDEADSSRLARRNLLYQNSVKAWLNYFRNEHRLVTVDVSCGVGDLIWHRVCDFFGHDLEFLPNKTVNTVVLFAFDNYDYSAIDLQRYHMELIHLKSILPKPDMSVSAALHELSKHIDKAAPTAESFCVDLSDTPITKDKVQVGDTKYEKRRETKFLEVEDTYLDRYIFISSDKKERGRKTSLYQQIFKVLATTENEVCLFPEEVDTKICQEIAYCFANYRHPSAR
ncbi:uncharacterized protein [Diadema setosum]|uniref:uncharacterized protein n=1 Tax=Diadema setosum TaxID=31175 RepID=UPI003B3A3502